MDPNCKPIHARAFTIPRSVEQKLNQSKEIVRLVDIGVLEENYSSKWASPSTPKKNGTIRAVTDFRTLNLLIKVECHPYARVFCSMLRGQSQFMIVIYFRLFL
jgi:hypothetical protein